MELSQTKVPGFSKGFKETSSLLTTNQTAVPDNFVAPTNEITGPEPVPASTIGTSDATFVPPPLDISSQLAQVKSQALAIQDKLNQQETQTAEGTTPTTELDGITAPTAADTGVSSARDFALQNFAGLLGEGFQLSEEAQGLQTAAAEANLRLKNLTTQIAQYDKETKDEEYRMRQNPEGKSMGAMQAGVQNYKYERYARPGGAADMAIEAQFALNNAEFAYEIANNAVSAEKEAYQTQLNGFRDLYNMLQNDMTTSEQLKYQSELSLYEQQITAFTESKNAAMQRATQAGAPEGVITAIKNARSTNEVWEAAGQYGEDPAMKLAWAKHDWEQQKYWADRALQEQIQAGEVRGQQALDIQTRNNALYEAGLYLTSVTDAGSNLKGLFEATGTTALGRMAPFSGDKRKFLSEAKYLLNNETFKKLAEITENTSLGAISEGELALVQSAATKLGGYAIYDGTELIGFDGSHEDVLAAVIELEDAQRRYMDKIRIGALTPEEYAAIGGEGVYATPEKSTLERAEERIEQNRLETSAEVRRRFGGSNLSL